MGTAADLATRKDTARHDTAELREKVTKAREHIKRGNVVTSTNVENLLAGESLVPIHVSALVVIRSCELRL